MGDPTVRLYAGLKAVDDLESRFHQFCQQKEPGIIKDIISCPGGNSLSFYWKLQFKRIRPDEDDHLPLPMNSYAERLELQVRIIEAYSSNPVLKSAVDGKKTLVDQFTELARRYEYVNNYVPRRYDHCYNSSVMLMDKLLEANFLKTEPVWAFNADNPFSGGIKVGTMSSAAASILYFGYDIGLDSIFIPLLSATALGVAVGTVEAIRRRVKIHRGIRQARFIDHQIETIQKHCRKLQLKE